MKDNFNKPIGLIMREKKIELHRDLYIEHDLNTFFNSKYFEYILELKEMFKSYNLNINSDLVIVRTSKYQYNNKKVMFLFEFIFEYSFRDYFGKLCIESLSKIILSKNDN